jgi:sugar phosphate isomerase/epimerase
MKTETSRRGFLGAAAGLAGLAAAGAPGASAAIEPEPWGIKLGVASYSLRRFTRAQAIEMIKALGTPWVSLKDMHMPFDSTPEQFKAARAEYEAAGIRIMSAGNTDMTKAPTTELLRRSFEYARNAGIPMLVCAPTHENLKLVEGLVKEYNISIAIHNHGPEDKVFPTPQSVLEAVRDLDPRCGLCMDVGHSARAGADVVKSIAEAGSRLLDMHVKDLRAFTPNGQQVDVGDGIMPFPGIFKQLKKMNYRGCVNLEYEINETNPMPGMQRSFSYMRGVLAGLAAS